VSTRVPANLHRAFETLRLPDFVRRMIAAGANCPGARCCNDNGVIGFDIDQEGGHTSVNARVPALFHRAFETLRLPDFVRRMIAAGANCPGDSGFAALTAA